MPKNYESKNKHRKINPHPTITNNSTTTLQQVVIVHLDYDLGSPLLTNFYRTIAKCKINSDIIIEHRALLSDEIISHTKSSQSIPPQLLYRGTRDGFKPEDFHSRCDNQGPTLTIIKSSTEEQNHIFGGFTTASWITPSSVFGEWMSDSSAFIFKIESYSNNDNSNGNVHHNQLPPVFRKFNVKPEKIDRAICGIADCLTSFGSGADFCIESNCHLNNNSYSNFGHSYELPPQPTSSSSEFERGKGYLAGSFFFRVSEIEVFKITTTI